MRASFLHKKSILIYLSVYLSISEKAAAAEEKSAAAEEKAKRCGKCKGMKKCMHGRICLTPRRLAREAVWPCLRPAPPCEDITKCVVSTL